MCCLLVNTFETVVKYFRTFVLSIQQFKVLYKKVVFIHNS